MKRYYKEDGQMPAIYKRFWWGRSWKMAQMIFFDIVLTFSKCMNRMDGGDGKWHFEIKARKLTNL